MSGAEGELSDKGSSKHKSPGIRKPGMFKKLSKVCELGGE